MIRMENSSWVKDGPHGAITLIVCSGNVEIMIKPSVLILSGAAQFFQSRLNPTMIDREIKISIEVDKYIKINDIFISDILSLIYN